VVKAVLNMNKKSKEIFHEVLNTIKEICDTHILTFGFSILIQMTNEDNAEKICFTFNEAFF